METIVFQTDYSPRKKGEEFTPSTNEDKKLAQWYLDNGLAKFKCDCKEDENKCVDCAGNKTEEVEEVKAKKTTSKKETKTEE